MGGAHLHNDRDEREIAVFEASDPFRLELIRRARRILSERRRRAEVFGKGMFREPAWEMLLLLYSTGARYSVSSLNRHLEIPITTILRWIAFLEEHGLVHLQSSPVDRRLKLVSLSKKGSGLLDVYLHGTLT